MAKETGLPGSGLRIVILKLTIMMGTIYTWKRTNVVARGTHLLEWLFPKNKIAKIAKYLAVLIKVIVK